MPVSLAPITARLLLLACSVFTAPVVVAAGLGEAPASGPDARSSERSARLEEMRRQLLEYQRQWNQSGAADRAAPPPTELAPGAAGPLGSGLHATPPITGEAAQAPDLPVPALKDRTVGILPPATSAAPAAADEHRLSDRERSLLRQQLRQLPPLR